jgi:NAD(P)-dependent dehydrogenase (short-subunit alcohol dehydrogenase family)
VNGAGIPARTSFLEGDPGRIELVLAINYLGTVWCTRAFLPALEAARPSDIVNVVSVAGTVAWAPAGPYGAAKAAQLAFSRATEVELRPRGVRVHTVNPGFVATEGFPQSHLARRPVLGRLVVGPEAIARHVLGVLDRDRRETFVPAWYRVAPLAQALVPGLIARRGGRFGRKRGV